MSKKLKVTNQVTKTRAIKIFKALGFKTADKWDVSRLQKKLGNLHDLIEGKDLDKKTMKRINVILKAINQGFELVVVDLDDVAGDKERSKELADSKIRTDSRVSGEKKKRKAKDNVMTKKKTKKKKAEVKAKKAVAASGKKKAEKKSKSPGVVMSVVEFIKDNQPVTHDKILSLLKKRFPEKNPDSMSRTIPRVECHLRCKKGIITNIKKDDKGQYIIKK